MEQLFLMQRYWGSDEENENQPNSKFSPLDESTCFNRKQKSNTSVIDLDGEDDCMLSTKKQSINSTVEINNKKHHAHNLHFTGNQQEIVSFISDSDNNMESVSGRKDSSLLGSIKSETLSNEIAHASSKIASKTIKKEKSEQTKFQKSNKKSNSSDLNIMSNNYNSIENIKIDAVSEIKSEGNKKKRKLKHSQQNNTESLPAEYDGLIKMIDSNDLLENNNIKTAINGIVDDDDNKKLKKLDSREIKKSSEGTSKQSCDAYSQNTESIDETFGVIGKLYHQKENNVKHNFPHWLSNPTYISINLHEEETPISELNYLDLNTKNNLAKTGINFLFPVQLAVIPWLMQSKEQNLLIRPSDICVSAPTGSGKTLAFVLPIIQSLKDRVVCAIRAVVVLPVSELAIQVFKVFETYITGTDLKVALLTGKKSFVAEQNALVKSSGKSVQSLVDIIVTTPGRVHDHIYKTRGFCLKRLRYLVIDEADRMMEEIQQGWLKVIEGAVFHDCIFSNCVCSSYKRIFHEPTCAYNFGFISQPLQKLLYSATLTHDPEQLHSLSLYKPKLFTTSSACSKKEFKGSCIVPSALKMLQVVCEDGAKPMVICHLMKQHKFHKVLCFTETVERAHRLHLVLEAMGLFQVREISSFNRAIQRKIVLDQFSSGKIDILVCSDLVARGIDIEDIDCVISYDVPQYVKTYIHRIGRTARASKTGTTIALLSEGEISHFRRMLNAAEIKLPEKVYINIEILKPLVNSYQAALLVADDKLKKEKNQLPGKLSKKAKRKRR